MARILHADLDAFYASVEQRDNPRLRGKPIIVGGGVVLAASYEARRFGVRTAMGVPAGPGPVPPGGGGGAPHAGLQPGQPGRVRDLPRHLPEVEPLSIDEAFLNVTGLRRLAGSDTEIAPAPPPPGGHGGGPAPQRGRLVPPSSWPRWPAPCASPTACGSCPTGGSWPSSTPSRWGRLWGVGPVSQERLAAIGVHTVADLAALHRSHLVAHLGPAAGRHLHALAHNVDPRVVETGRRRRSVGSQHSFRAGTVNRAGAEEILLEVVDRVTSRLRKGRRVARTIVLRLRFGDFTQATRSRTLPEATDSTAPVLATARGLLAEAWPLIEQRGLTKVGVAVTGLGDQARASAQPAVHQDRWRSARRGH